MQKCWSLEAFKENMTDEAPRSEVALQLSVADIAKALFLPNGPVCAGGHGFQGR